MIPELGHFAMILALLLAVVQGVLGIAGAHRGVREWMAVARPAAMGQFVFVAFAWGCLVYSFVTDDFSIGRIYVGNIATGKMLPLCDTGASCSSPQCTHPHAYMTPGNRHVIFNSDKTGLGQVWAAAVPEEFLEALE